tara:strand:- start:115 stop:900 length:786 start_codon:yes stop_codon:yes gene_type:complete
VTVLSVNLNKVALLRNSRESGSPSVVGAAETVLAAGAHGITVHPRPDQRHIRPHDVFDLAQLLEDYPGIEFNIEGNPFAGPRPGAAEPYPGFDALIESTRPDQATLVPDTDDQLTSDHGFDLIGGDVGPLAARIRIYQTWGARVSLFMDPVAEQITRARDIGADRVELYTGPFADLAAQHGIDHDLSRSSYETYLQAARHATQLGLGVNAGHDLDTNNLRLFAGITEVDEVSIGHALICDALESGLADTVRAYLRALHHDI